MSKLKAEDIREKAYSIGFNRCQFAKAEELLDERKHLFSWLEKEYQAKMDYMERLADKKTDPKLLLADVKTVVVCSVQYASSKENTYCGDEYKISRYAYGKDYHDVIRPMLEDLLALMKAIDVGVEGRCFVDSGPVMDKAWAVRSGLGWQGKNSCIIHPEDGSFFFIGILLLNRELTYDEPIENACGNCRLCMDACPTQAIRDAGVVDANRCISYLNKEAGGIPTSMRDKMQGWLFGCDVCQELCPWNKRSEAKVHADFLPTKKQLALKKEDWDAMTEENFTEIFPKSPMHWLGHEKIKQNIRFFNEE